MRSVRDSAYLATVFWIGSSISSSALQTPPDTKAKRIEHFINAFNKHRMKGFSAGSGIVLDESIRAFRPFFDNTPEGIGWLVKMIRKPKGVGAELKNAACAVTGVMLFLELQEGKDEMAAKELLHGKALSGSSPSSWC